MSFWAVTFLEYWKRKNATLAHHWDCMDFHEEEVWQRILQRVISVLWQFFFFFKYLDNKCLVILGTSTARVCCHSSCDGGEPCNWSEGALLPRKSPALPYVHWINGYYHNGELGAWWEAISSQTCESFICIFSCSHYCLFYPSAVCGDDILSDCHHLPQHSECDDVRDREFHAAHSGKHSVKQLITIHLSIWFIASIDTAACNLSWTGYLLSISL